MSAGREELPVHLANGQLRIVIDGGRLHIRLYEQSLVLHTHAHLDGDEAARLGLALLRWALGRTTGDPNAEDGTSATEALRDVLTKFTDSAEVGGIPAVRTRWVSEEKLEWWRKTLPVGPPPAGGRP